MHIGLISDTHNNLQNVRRAVKRFQEENITTILHAGDVTEPNILEALKGFTTWIAWGNMDRDASIQETATRLFGEGHIRNVQHLTLEGKEIALLHGDDQQKLVALIRSGIYDYVIHGHTHKRRHEQIDKTHVINPGALGGPGWHTASFAILELETGDVTYLEP